MIAFGPVPSRRLGKSLGVNNIPRKVCTYECLYCQVGKTKLLTVERKRFYGASRVVEEVKSRAAEVVFDYITFVPDGEPTLDADLGEEIRELKELGKVAVISNGSLLWKDGVKEDLMAADWVSVKVDAGSENTWKVLNRPADELKYEDVKRGMIEFSDLYKGALVTETMLVKGYNDDEDELRRIADFLKELSPEICYISLPIRPPAYDVSPASKEAVDIAYMIFSSSGLNVKLLDFPEEGEFVAGKDPLEGILSIAAVHPMREEDVKKILDGSGLSWRDFYELVEKKKLERIEYMGKIFYRKR